MQLQLGNSQRILTIRPVLLLVGVAVFGLLVTLGNWQMDRADFKEQKQIGYAVNADARGVELNKANALSLEDYSKVWVRGEFISDAPLLYLDNRTRKLVHGFHVLALFQPESLVSPVLVNLGWIAQRRERRDLPDVTLPQGPLELYGLLLRPPEDTFRLGPDEAPINSREWIIQSVEISDLEERLGYRLASFVFLLRPEQGFGLIREWKPSYKVGPAKHRAYAFQWYSLAVAWTVLLFFASLKKRHERLSDPS